MEISLAWAEAIPCFSLPRVALTADLASKQVGLVCVAAVDYDETTPFEKRGGCQVDAQSFP